MAFCPRLFHHSGESFASTYSVRILGAIGGSQCRSMVFFKAAPKRKNQNHRPKNSHQKKYPKILGGVLWLESFGGGYSRSTGFSWRVFDWRVSCWLLCGSELPRSEPPFFETMTKTGKIGKKNPSFHPSILPNHSTTTTPRVPDRWCIRSAKVALAKSLYLGVSPKKNGGPALWWNGGLPRGSEWECSRWD